MTSTKIPAAACIACFALLAACEHPGASAPRLAPSPSAQANAAAAALSAPAADVRRAGAVLAENVDGWTRPQAAPARVDGSRTDAAALAAPADLAAARAGLNGYLGGGTARAGQAPPR
ncbi:hypothetical protein [Longimicrobium sp.]|uniref:hypothetical protein n=1 Tax=Longimicrobium sp. TaxID=2029185 RepID=UPI002E371293|nr:hypothetical protein [Longimicrobium sp.]HEX6036450.1 hypothetical protein [Longimicrobium sp.]